MIIISPTKTMKFENVESFGKEPSYDYKKILNKLRKLSKAKLSEAYKIKDKILDTTYHNIKNYEDLPKQIAIKAYQGLSYQGIDFASYTDEERDFMENNLRILSAFHGVLTPETSVRQYRLDFNTKLDIDLYDYWKIELEGPIINLASNEYSKMINQPMITIQFMEEINGIYKNKATYAKQARGYFVDYLIKSQSLSNETLKGYNDRGYQYNDYLSDDKTIIYTRKG